MVIKCHDFKIFPSLLRGCPTLQLQNIAIPTMAFSFHSFKILPNLHMEFFWIDNPSCLFVWFFLDICRNYVSITITIVNNITVLVSYNAIILFYLWLWAIVSIKAPPNCLLLPLSPYQFFTRFCSLFYKKYFVILFSYQIICER